MVGQYNQLWICCPDCSPSYHSTDFSTQQYQDILDRNELAIAGKILASTRN